MPRRPSPTRLPARQTPLDTRRRDRWMRRPCAAIARRDGRHTSCAVSNAAAEDLIHSRKIKFQFRVNLELTMATATSQTTRAFELSNTVIFGTGRKLVVELIGTFFLVFT